MLFPKFIVYDNEILLDKVQYHKDLLPKNPDKKLIAGGGLFKIDLKNNTITLYGESMDFGRFKDISSCSLPEDLKDFKIVVLDTYEH